MLYFGEEVSWGVTILITRQGMYLPTYLPTYLPMTSTAHCWTLAAFSVA
jgi:hypothetical protein